MANMQNRAADRATMCYQYMKELDLFRYKPVRDEFTLRMLAIEMLGRVNNEYIWVDIQEGENIGFLAFSQSAPSVDLMLEHCYVRPEFRRKGYMKNAYSEFIDEYLPLVCGAVLFDRNPGMKSFVDDFIAYHDGCYLDGPIPTKHPGLNFYRFLLTN